jgi:hypothetical protein
MLMKRIGMKTTQYPPQDRTGLGLGRKSSWGTPEEHTIRTRQTDENENETIESTSSSFQKHATKDSLNEAVS